MNSRRLMAFSNAERTPYHIVEKSGVVHHSKPLESELHWEGINQDDSDELAGVGLRVEAPEADPRM
jgi:hypothetical protein